MSRISIAVIAVLLGVIGVQAWWLNPPLSLAQTVGSSTENTLSEAALTAQALPANAANEKLLTQLARIDARLAALEIRSPDTKQEPLEKTLDLLPGSPLALAADRKLRSMLPSNTPSQEEVMQFHGSLGSLPEPERIALAAALSRAINEDRIKPRL
jgi:hypothetical protein